MPTPKKKPDSEVDSLKRIVTGHSPSNGAQGPQPISEIVSRLMTRRGYANFQTVSEWSDAWRQVAGTQANHTRTGKFNRGVLEVLVRNSVVMQELTFRKKNLLKSMQEQYPQFQIKDLKFRVGVIE